MTPGPLPLNRKHGHACKGKKAYSRQHIAFRVAAKILATKGERLYIYSCYMTRKKYPHHHLTREPQDFNL